MAVECVLPSRNREGKETFPSMLKSSSCLNRLPVSLGLIKVEPHLSAVALPLTQAQKMLLSSLPHIPVCVKYWCLKCANSLAPFSPSTQTTHSKPKVLLNWNPALHMVHGNLPHKSVKRSVAKLQSHSMLPFYSEAVLPWPLAADMSWHQRKSVEREAFKKTVDSDEHWRTRLSIGKALGLLGLGHACNPSLPFSPSEPLAVIQ